MRIALLCSFIFLSLLCVATYSAPSDVDRPADIPKLQPLPVLPPTIPTDPDWNRKIDISPLTPPPRAVTYLRPEHIEEHHDAPEQECPKGDTKSGKVCFHRCPNGYSYPEGVQCPSK